MAEDSEGQHHVDQYDSALDDPTSSSTGDISADGDIAKDTVSECEESDDEEELELLTELEKQLNSVQNELSQLLSDEKTYLNNTQKVVSKPTESISFRHPRRPPRRLSLDEVPPDFNPEEVKPTAPERTVHRNAEFDKIIQERNRDKQNKKERYDDGFGERKPVNPKQVLGQQADLRDYCRDVYLEALQRKVKLQRQKLKEAEERRQAAIAAQQEKAAMKRKMKKTAKSQNTTDMDFLRTVPKSSYYYSAVEEFYVKKEPPVRKAKPVVVAPPTSRKRSGKVRQRPIEVVAPKESSTNSWAITGMAGSDEEDQANPEPSFDLSTIKSGGRIEQIMGPKKKPQRVVSASSQSGKVIRKKQGLKRVADSAKKNRAKAAALLQGKDL